MVSIIEKYPDSYRLDHPDFGDVCKTTFAKGVISDFKIDDPFDLIGTIHSQVKVTGGFGESDWIPLFYHPKEQFWDDENAKATDLNQEEVNFERAWMSFRKDDEVAVMLKEGVPVAAMGFADGVPRPGESCIKWERGPLFEGDTGPYSGYRLLLGDFVVEDELGPDGKSLSLKLEAVWKEGGTATWSSQPNYTDRTFNGFYTTPGGYHMECPGYFIACDCFNPPWGGGQADCAVEAAACTALGGTPDWTVDPSPRMVGMWNYTPPTNYQFKTRVFVMVVGPFLIASYLLLRRTNDPGGAGLYDFDVGYYDQAYIDWCDEPPTERSDPPPVGGSWSADNGGPPSPPVSSEWVAVNYADKIGLYSKELYEQVLSAFPSILTTGGGGYAEFGNNFPAGLQDSFGLSSYVASDMDGPWRVDDVHFKVRPHTKPELQAAGMWPGGS